MGSTSTQYTLSVAGLVRVKKNNMQFDYTVRNDTGNCRVTLDQYRFSEIEDVKLSGSSLQYEEIEGDDIFKEDEELLFLVNSFLNNGRQAVEDTLQALCDDPAIPSPSEPLV